jgi:hypothetical protein
VITAVSPETNGIGQTALREHQRGAFAFPILPQRNFPYNAASVLRHRLSDEGIKKNKPKQSSLNLRSFFAGT